MSGGSKMKIRPNHLNRGDTVGVIALSGPANLEKLTNSIEVLQELGLHVKLGQTIGLKEGYLAGSDRERVEDLHRMIEDPEVRGIFCISGGYGAGRIADKIDYPLLTENPKIFWGFSDVTYLHIAFQQLSNVVTFHGPNLSSEMNAQTKKMFLQLFAPFEIYYDETYSPLETIIPGSVRGEIAGGNLRRIVDTLGTKFELDTRGKILLLEEVGESLENIDSMLNQLRLSRKLSEASGFAIGSFTGVEKEAVLALIKEYLKPYHKPALVGFGIGHAEPNIGIPLGVEAILDADEKVLRLLPGVE